MNKSPSLHLLQLKGVNMSKSNNKPKIKKSKIFNIPNYAQSEEFTSSAACTMMVLKYINKDFKMKKEIEFDIWNDTLGGSVWHGSKYGIAYALAKRGAKPKITSNNQKDEGYERKLAVYEGINLDTLRASYNEIKEKASKYNIKEEHKVVTINLIKKEIDEGKIPIILANSNTMDSSESAPQWMVIKGYDEDTFYINDPYSDNTITMEPLMFKDILGYDEEFHMISVKARKSKDIKNQ